MNDVPTTAMVLAAGLGTRMRPVTERLPKPLIEVGGRTLLDHTLDRFASAGVERVVINVHHLAEMIEAHIAARTSPEVTVSDEREMLLETGGGLKRAAPLLGDKPIFCTNTDAILIDDNGGEACARLAAAWDTKTMDALLLLAPIGHTSGYGGAGDFDMDDTGRLAFRAGAAAPYVFTGLQILNPDLLEGAPEGPFSTRLLWQKALEAGRLFGLVHKGFWLHVGDPAGLDAARARLGGRDGAP